MLGLIQYVYGCIDLCSFFLVEGTYHGGGLLFGEGAMMRGNRFTNHTSGVHNGKPSWSSFTALKWSKRYTDFKMQPRFWSNIYSQVNFEPNASRWTAPQFKVSLISRSAWQGKNNWVAIFGSSVLTTLARYICWRRFAEEALISRWHPEPPSSSHFISHMAAKEMRLTCKWDGHKKARGKKHNALSVAQETNKEMHSICRSAQPQDTHSRLRLYLADEVA